MKRKKIEHNFYIDFLKHLKKNTRYMYVHAVKQKKVVNMQMLIDIILHLFQNTVEHILLA